MFWYGAALGFCVGVVLVSIAYNKLTARFDLVDATLQRRTELMQEAIDEVGRVSTENTRLRREVKNLLRLVPPAARSLYDKDNT
jgi:hypothetical protein